jgi:hypothetical protein
MLPRHDLIGSSALVAGARKDFISAARVTVPMVIVATVHAMMMAVLVAVTIHAVAIISMVVAFHMVVTAVVPGRASTTSMCLGHGCRAGDQDCCPKAGQKFPILDHGPPSRVAARSALVGCRSNPRTQANIGCREAPADALAVLALAISYSPVQ